MSPRRIGVLGERRDGVDQIVDATPVPGWLLLTSKLLGLAGVVLFIFIALIVPMLRLSAAISA